ncbi:ATP-dependent permease MDL2, mitochondrial [Hanseniaspora uvarum DSM 2768]|nr:ATP-dependent permease MDL2, mitochondrial [Hanseniaspora uvarum DSM 2768]
MLFTRVHSRYLIPWKNINIKPIQNDLLTRKFFSVGTSRFITKPTIDIYKTPSIKTNIFNHQTRLSFSQSFKKSQKDEKKKIENEENEPDQQWFNIFKRNKNKNGNKQSFNFEDYMKLIQFIKREKKLLLTVILFTLIASCGFAMQPKITGIVLDSIKNSMDNDISFSDTTVMGYSIGTFSAGFAVLMLVCFASYWTRSYLGQILGEKVTLKIRSKLMKSLMYKDTMKFYDVNKTGDLLSRLSADCQQVSSGISQSITEVLRSTMLYGISVAMMASISPIMTIPVLIWSGIYFFLVRNYGAQQVKVSKSWSEKLGGLGKISQEQLDSIKNIKVNNSERKELTRYHGGLKDLFKVIKTRSLLETNFSVITYLGMDTLVIVSLFWGAYSILSGGSMTIGNLTAFLMYIEYCSVTVQYLGGAFSSISKSVGSGKRLFEILDDDKVHSPYKDLQNGKLKKFSANKVANTIGTGFPVEFKNVDFAYPLRPDNFIFKNLNFKVQEGSSVCIVGPSGKGKSTIASLLLKYYPVNNGSIFVNDQSISSISSSSLRKEIAVVQQVPSLITGTIKDNILYGLTDKEAKLVTQKEIEEVCKQANCHTFISQLPNGYNEKISGGSSDSNSLSGGQSQRICIARALMKKPKLLVLDEATSALDVKSEKLVNDALIGLVKRRECTIISIAHRLSTIQSSENVIVLNDKGYVEEVGPFWELYSDDYSALSKLLREDIMAKNQEKKNIEEDDEIIKKNEDGINVETNESVPPAV